MSKTQKLFAGIGFGIVTVAAASAWLSGLITLGNYVGVNDKPTPVILGLVGFGIAWAIACRTDFNQPWRRTYTLGATLAIGIVGSIMLFALSTTFTISMTFSLATPVVYGIFASAAKPERKIW